MLTERFMKRGAVLPGVDVRPSHFGTHGPSLWVGQRQIAHPRGENLEIRLTRETMREMRGELQADLRINLRHPGSDWILVYLRRAADVDRAIELLRVAIRANTIGA